MTELTEQEKHTLKIIVDNELLFETLKKVFAVTEDRQADFLLKVIKGEHAVFNSKDYELIGQHTALLGKIILFNEERFSYLERLKTPKEDRMGRINEAR